MGWGSYGSWRRYIPVAERRRRAEKKVAKLKKSGREVSPVEIVGRKITATFWGGAWCKNLEAYSDYSNRMPRGRTYVRNGSVVDLQIKAGRVRALVSGSDLYQVAIKIKPLAKKRWAGIKGQCAGQIGSLVELLEGSISKGVMEIVSRKSEGLFPAPREISLDCSCPDWATMCKHVAATLYGVGARLDHEPELLFTLRGVDPAELVEAAIDQPSTRRRSRSARLLQSGELSSVFGVDIDMGGASAGTASTPAKRARRVAKSRKKGVRRGKRKTQASSAKKKPASVAKKAAGKTPARKTKARKATAKQASTGRSSAKKTTSKKSATRKAAGKTARVRKSTVKKRAATKKATSRKKTPARPSRRR